MKFEEFELERNQSLFEHKVDFNLSESGLHPLPLKEILTVEEQSTLLEKELVYGHTNGTPYLRDNISMLSNFGTVYSQNSLLYNKSEKKIVLDGNVLINLKNPEAKINANRLNSAKTS